MNTKDPVIAIACAQGGHVLVSHDNDFKGIAKRLQVTQRAFRQHLHRIQLECGEPEGAARIAELMSLIEHEWAVAVEKNHPLHIAIRSNSVWVGR